MFQIKVTQPVYCSITSAILGSSAHIADNTYETYELAAKLAEAWAHEEFVTEVVLASTGRPVSELVPYAPGFVEFDPNEEPF